MKSQLHRNLLQTSGLQPVPAVRTVDVTTPADAAAEAPALSVAQDNHASPVLQRKGEGSATAAAAAQRDCCRNPSTSTADVTSANHTAAKQAKRKMRSERISKDTRAAH